MPRTITKKNRLGSRPCEYFSSAKRKKNKIVELWLTREEKEDAAFRESLKPLYQQYKAQNYLVAVFLSGEADLYQQTRDLLLYNRRRQAEKEVLAQKQAQQAMTM